MKVQPTPYKGISPIERVLRLILSDDELSLTFKIEFAQAVKLALVNGETIELLVKPEINV